MTPLIECRSVSRRFTTPGAAPVLAVSNVDLIVGPGEFVAIEGPSGSGKTTLLGLLAGIDRPDEGTVSVLGHDVARLTEPERCALRRRRIGIVFQSFGLLAALSVFDNVALPLTLDGVDPVDRPLRVRAALDEVGLSARETSRIDELSGGERQRVGVARALVNDPRLLLADEPTGSLDEANGAAVLDLLVDASRSHGATLVLVTHDPASVARADRGYRMRDGRLTTEVA